MRSAFNPSGSRNARRPEKGISAATVQVLDKMGHTVQNQTDCSDGECVAIAPPTGERWARATSGTKERR